MTLKRNLVANYLGQGWVALMGLAFIPQYIKYLGIEAYGLIGLYAVLQAWLSLLDMGMTPTLGREMARFTGGGHSNESIRDLLRSIETIALGIAGIIAGGVALGSNWIARYWLKVEALPIEVVAQAFAIMGLVIALRFVEGVYRSAIIGLQQQVLFNVVHSITATLRWLGAVVVLAWVSSTIEAFFLWQGLVSVATLAVLVIATYGNLPKCERGGRFSIKALSSVWRFAGGMTAITLLSVMLMQTDKIILSKLLNLSELGYYSLASVLAGALYMILTPIGQAWFPKLTELYTNNQQASLIEKYHQAAQLAAVFMGSIAIIMVVFAQDVLYIWTQDLDVAQNSANLLSLLALGNLLNGLMWIPYQAQLAHGWTGLTLQINLVSVIVILPALFLTIPRYGPEGAALVWLCLNVGYLLIGVHFMYRKILTGEKWKWYRQDVLMPLVSALIVSGAIKISWPYPDDFWGRISMLGFASLMALLTSGFASSHVRFQVKRLIKSHLSKLTASKLLR